MKKYHREVLDKLWSKIVRTRDSFTCQRCGKRHDKKSRGLHAHHILTKGSHGFSIRWDLDNGVAVCYGCHMFLQGNPDENEYFAKNILGIDYDGLKRLGKKTVKVFYNEKKSELKDILEDLQVGREMI